jgi:hypothetical protein
MAKVRYERTGPDLEAIVFMLLMLCLLCVVDVFDVFYVLLFELKEI